MKKTHINVGHMHLWASANMFTTGLYLSEEPTFINFTYR